MVRTSLHRRRAHRLSGVPIAFATDWIKVAVRRLAPQDDRALKPSENGNSDRYDTSWNIRLP